MNNTLTEEQAARVKYTLSTAAIEDAVPDKDAIRLCEEIAKGNMTGDEAIAILDKMYGFVRCGKRGKRG